MTFPLPVLFSLRIDSNTYWHQLNSYLERVHGIPVHNFLYVGLFIQLSTYQACVTTNQLANQIELYHAGFLVQCYCYGIKSSEQFHYVKRATDYLHYTF